MRQSHYSQSEEAAFLLDTDNETSEKLDSDVDLPIVRRRPLFHRFIEACTTVSSECRKHSATEWIRCGLYIFVPTFLRKSSVSPSRTSTYAHLDGLRGVAALFVFFFHSSYTIWNVRPGYLSAPEYSSFLRLPFIRLLYAGDAMVSIFFIVSGFVLSIKPVKLMHANDREGIFNAVASAGFRRGIRLFAPCFVSTFLVMLAIRIGLFEYTREMADNKDLLRGSGEFHMFRFESFTSQIWHWCKQSYNFVHVWDWTNIYAGNTGYDIHLWTIPDEYRCSMLLFLTQIILASASSLTRIATLLGLVAFAASWGRWEMMCFWSGAILAELDVVSVSSLPMYTISGAQSNEKKRRTNHLRRTAWCLVFVLALYLLSFPDALPQSTHGYETLFGFVPKTFGQKNRFWQAIGAFFTALAINNVDFLQHMFTWGPIKYLGKISFALYLMHGLVIHTLGYTLLPIMWSITGRESVFAIGLGWFMSQTIVTAVVIYAADIFWTNVDIPSNRLCHWLESVYFQKKS